MFLYTRYKKHLTSNGKWSQKNYVILQEREKSYEEMTIIKGDLRPKLHPCFYDTFFLILWRKSLVQSFAVFDQLSRSYKVTEFWVRRNDVIPANAQNVSPLVFFAKFYNFMEKDCSAKFYVTFNQFLRFYEIRKFWLIKLVSRRKWRHPLKWTYIIC